MFVKYRGKEVKGLLLLVFGSKTVLETVKQDCVSQMTDAILLNPDCVSKIAEFVTFRRASWISI